MTVHFCINGCGNVAPAPVIETDEVGCHPATDDVTEAIVVAEVIVSEVIIDSVVLITGDVTCIIDEVSCMLVLCVLELLLVAK